MKIPLIHDSPAEDSVRGLSPPEISTSSMDLLAVIRRQLEEGTTPPDPDRKLATAAPASPKDSLVWKRARMMAEAAFEAAETQAAFETAILRNRAVNNAQHAAERQPIIEQAQERSEALGEGERFYDAELRSLAYRPLGKFESIRYYMTQLLLAGADVGNIAAATHNVLGDPLPLAIIQGVGVGLANVSMGQLGAEYRARREQAKRPSKAPDDGEAFESWFGEDSGETLSNHALAVCGLGVGLTFIGQLALRAVFDGAPVGLVYASFAVVVVLGSFANSYFHGAQDDVTRYKATLDTERDALTDQITELKHPEAVAAGLQAEIDAITEGYLAQGKAIGRMAKVEALTLMIQQPNIFGTHDAEFYLDHEEDAETDLESEMSDLDPASNLEKDDNPIEAPIAALQHADSPGGNGSGSE